MPLFSSEGSGNEDFFVSTSEVLSGNDAGDVYRYVSEVDELDLGKYSGSGMLVFGVGVLVSLLTISVLSWLKRE